MTWTKERLRKAKDDLGRVEENARRIVRLGSSIEVHHNEKGRLDIIGIIGPASSYGREFDNVLITEIGVGRGRPFHEARGNGRQSYESNIPYRNKWFGLSGEYTVLENIFLLLKEISIEKVHNRKCSHYSIKGRRRWYRGINKQVYRNIECFYPRGSRFSFSKKDPILLGCLFQMELKYLKDRFSKAARFIDLRLSPLRGRKSLKPSDFGKALGDVSVKMEEMPDRYKRAILKSIPGGIHNPFFGDIVQHYNIPLEETAEEKLIKSVCSYAIENYININLEVISALGDRKDYVVFEIFPYTEKIYHNPSAGEIVISESGNDWGDCPF